MDTINSLIDNGGLPTLSALLLGLLAALSPCTLVANVAAVAFLSRELREPRRAFLHGLFYTLGRALSYSILGTAVYFGVSAFTVSRVFEGWGGLLLGPVLVLAGLVLAGVIRLKFKVDLSQLQSRLDNRGYLGAFLLGMILALAFCPYSGVLFFGALIPLAGRAASGLLLPAWFALGTSLPVLVFATLIVLGVHRIGVAFAWLQKVEKIGRWLVAAVFVLAGLYYCRSLLVLIVNYFKI